VQFLSVLVIPFSTFRLCYASVSYDYYNKVTIAQPKRISYINVSVAAAFVMTDCWLHVWDSLLTDVPNQNQKSVLIKDIERINI